MRSPPWTAAYIADAGNNEVRELSAATDDISLTAGDGQDLASAGNGGPAVNGQLIEPGGEIADSHGDIYVSDSQNNRVQEIAAYTHTQWGIAMTGGDVYTIAGSAAGVAGNSGDTGPAAAALLSDPQGLAFDNDGNLLITDFYNNQVRVVDAEAGTNTIYGQPMTDGDIYTIAGQTSGASGTAGDGGPAASGYLYRPQAIAVDADGDVYIADKDNNRVQEIQAAGGISWGQTMAAGDIYTVAGSATGQAGSSGDGGPATSALLGPEGVAVDAAGDLIIADTAGEQVRMVPVAAGTYYGQAMKAHYIYTLAGSTGGTGGDSGDGGPAVDSELYTPIGLATDPAGDIYIADAANDRIQEIAGVSGTAWQTQMTADDIYTIAGKPGTASSAGDGGPAGMATVYFAVSAGTDSYGDLYIGDQSGGQLREVTSDSPATIAPAPGLTSALYPAPGSTIGSTTYPAGITVTQPGGAQITFYPKVSGACTQPMVAAGGYCVLPVNSGATLTASGTTSYTFSPSVAAGTWTYSWAGQLTAETDPAGIPLTITASSPAPGSAVSGDASQVCPATAGGVATTSCQTITSASGRALVLGSDGNGQVTSVTDPLGRQWTYTYSGCTTTTPDVCDLTSATDPMGNTTSYTYDTGNASPLLAADLLTITSPDAQPGYSGADADPGAATVNTYDSLGRVTTQTDPMGNKTTWNYCVSAAAGDCLNAATGTGLVTVTDPDGNTTVYDYNQATLAAESDWTGSTLTTEQDYGPDLTADGSAAAGTLNDTWSANGDNAVTTTSYDTNGDVVSTTAPSPDGQGTATTTAWYNAQDNQSCTAGAMAATPCSASQTGPGSVAPGAVITPPSSAPPAGVTFTLYDTDGNQLYSTTGVYSPGGSYEYSQTSYQLYTGNSVTLPGTSTAITCTTQPPAPSLPCATISPDGVVTQLAYNSAGDLTSSSAPDGNGAQLATATAGYDGDGDQTAATAPDGNVPGGSYDNTGIDNDGTGGGNFDGGSYAYSAQALTAAGAAPGAAVTAGGITFTWPATGDTPDNYQAAGQTISVSGSGSISFLGAASFGPSSGTATVTFTDGTTQPVPLSFSDWTLDGGTASVESGNTVAVTTPYRDSPAGAAQAVTTDVFATTPVALTAGKTAASVTLPSSVSTGAIHVFAIGFTSTSAANYTTTTGYDTDGDPTSVTRGGGTGHTGTPRTTSYTYDGDGNKVTVTDPRGYVTTTAYNADDEPTLATDPDGNTTLTCYDGDGDVTQTVPPAGVKAGSLTPASCPPSYPSGYGDRLAADATTTAYNAAGARTVVTTPAPAGQSSPAYETTSYTYDGAGNPVQVSTPAAATGGPAQLTVSTYNPAGSLVTQTTGSGTPAASTVSYCYDPDGDQTSVVMPDGNTAGTAGCQTASPWTVSSASYPTQAAYQTTSSYDSAGELVSSTTPATAAAPSGGTTTNTYDPAGNLLTSTDPDGTITTATYTPAGQTATIAYSGTGTLPHAVSYSYDADGSQTAMTDGTGTSTYSYDPFGELTSATSGAGQTVGYSYDADGDTTAITYPLPATATWATTDAVGYGYDKADTITSVTDFAGNTIAITNNADSLPATETLGSTGDTITTSYDSTDSPSAIALTNSAGTTLQSFSYADAPDGSTLSETDVPAATSASYSYDGKGRIASMTIGSSPALDYGFDASGNLTTLPAGAAGSYDHNSELTSATLSGTTTSYTYNADGDRLTSAQGATTLTSGTWNGAGELTAYTSPAATMSAAGYDGNGLRQSATFTPADAPATTQNYVWNTSGATPELLMDSATAYIYAGSGTPVEQVSLTTGTPSYLNTDCLGSVRGIISAAGALTATTSYDAWGNPQTSGGLTAYTPFGYAGAYTDPDGLLYLINRYYDPATGQFTSLDPAVAKTLAPYGYASGNPVNTTDPDGLMAEGAPGSPAVDGSGNNGSGDVGGHGNQQVDPCIAAGDCDAYYQHVTHYTPPRPKPRPTHHCGGIFGFVCSVGHWASHEIRKHLKAIVKVGLGIAAAGLTAASVLQLGLDPVTDGLDAADIGAFAAEDTAADADADADVDAATCGGESFAAGTKVLLATGTAIPISQLKPGDKVEATNVKTGKTQAEPVAAVMVKRDTDRYDLTIKTAHGSAVIHTTRRHLFWDVTDGRWVKAGKLKHGDHLRTSNGAAATVVSGRSPADKVGWMWDISVPGGNDHDFYIDVATTAVLVHNCPKYTGPMDPDDEDYPDDSEPMKGRGGGTPNYAENPMARDAANQVGLDQDQATTLHRMIGGRQLSYQEIVEYAERIAGGDY